MDHSRQRLLEAHMEHEHLRPSLQLRTFFLGSWRWCDGQQISCSQRTFHLTLFQIHFRFFLHSNIMIFFYYFSGFLSSFFAVNLVLSQVVQTLRPALPFLQPGKPSVDHGHSAIPAFGGTIFCINSRQLCDRGTGVG